MVRVMVNNLIVWLVVSGSQVLLSKSQANSIGNTLSKRTYMKHAKVGIMQTSITVILMEYK